MMKKLRYSIWLIATIGLLLWLAHQSVSEPGAATAPAVAQLLPPAPYPPDFEQQLSKCELEITVHPETELPAELPWQCTTEAPLIGSPRAVKGGTLRLCNVGPFPSNFLAFGSISPQFFHYNLFERIDIPLVWEHPATGQPMAGLACAWCRQGDSLYFRLNGQARYSNGRPVRARDFALGVSLRQKCGDVIPAQHIHAIRIYGDSVVEVVTPPRYADILTISRLLKPAEPGFYADFGSNYREAYAQRIPPTTGAYTVAEIQRGRLIALQKVPNWWAADLPGFRYTHNPNRIEHHFFTDEAQSWQAFINGRLDIMQTRNVAAWQSKLDGVPAAEEGRIRLHSLRIEQPMPPYGIALNTNTLPDINLRRGLLQAMDMSKAVDILFRGYAERLPHFTSGYRQLRHHCKQYDYNPEVARACFAQAGYTVPGPDGILRRPDGTRLSVRLSFTPSEKLNTIVTILAQSAATSGAEIVPEPLPWQNISRQLEENNHELTFWATMPGLPMPDYGRFFHSESSGHDAPFGLNDSEIDDAITLARKAETEEQAQSAANKIDSLIFHRAIWLPGWMENRANIAAWQHVQLPENYAGVYDIAESHQLWIEP